MTSTLALPQSRRGAASTVAASARRSRSTAGARSGPASPMVQVLWQLRKEYRAVDEELVFTAERGAIVDASNVMSRV